jgi:hypothetical protein
LTPQSNHRYHPGGYSARSRNSDHGCNATGWIVGAFIRKGGAARKKDRFPAA